MVVVALFRNSNQGQGVWPRSTDLVSLFLNHGAVTAKPIRGNGTVIVQAVDAVDVTNRVRDAIAHAGPWNDVVLVRPAAWTLTLADSLSVDAPNAEVAFLDASGRFPERLP